MTSNNNRASLLCPFKFCVSFHSHLWTELVSYNPETINSGQNRCFSVPCDLEIWLMTLMKFNMAPLLYYFKLCTSFQSHQWIQTGVTVRIRSIRVKIGDFLSCVTLKFDRLPWKLIRHLFNTKSRFLHRFKAISEFELELQSGNTQFRSKSTIFCLLDLEICWMT